ncbi:hypothetical protein BDQ94DRAFT_139991 [Aspergillus welwitschiae]|uniref:Secreted protein n=1 Tax=Aspergillus welwitschiae TaxID=1341132 RepID=A0A3F3Q8W0_9EURO|nr:hypothetical protein BDQ94DRAFT_139991 [Aspergillus welwitschiae]RDH35640.1 hypothetical protein BDQ94DRAFT_139991 [Aspergillus welwitschiae]
MGFLSLFCLISLLSSLFPHLQVPRALVLWERRRGKSGAAQNYQSLIRLLPDRSKMSGNLSLDVFRRGPFLMLPV